MNKKIMITGVAGLIGSHLAEKLLDLDYEVHGLDVVDLEQSNNLSVLRGKKGVNYYKGDITSQNDLDKFFTDNANINIRIEVNEKQTIYRIIEIFHQKLYLLKIKKEITNIIEAT